MKKTVLFAIAALMVASLALVGCQKKEEAPVATEAPQAAPAPAPAMQAVTSKQAPAAPAAAPVAAPAAAPEKKH